MVAMYTFSADWVGMLNAAGALLIAVFPNVWTLERTVDCDSEMMVRMCRAGGWY